MFKLVCGPAADPLEEKVELLCLPIWNSPQISSSTRFLCETNSVFFFRSHFCQSSIEGYLKIAIARHRRWETSGLCWSGVRSRSFLSAWEAIVERSEKK